VRHTPEQKARWELARRAAEARVYPKGEGTLPMQIWMAESLTEAAETELARRKR
jgi:hypothetical protein